MKTKFTVSTYLWLLVIVSAFLFRIINIGNNPPSLSWDEVSIGYNAYSILKTSFDEHRRFLPLDTFVAYGDYKPPLAIYLTIPAVAFFGLNEFAVRLPSALFGTLTVLLTYFLVKELFRYGLQKVTNYLPLLSSFLLAISPWHINLSRAGFEANIALFFVVLGIIVLLKTRENKKLWFIAWIPFVLAMYTFNSARYMVLLFSLGFIVIKRKSILRSLKLFVIGIGIALVTTAPLIPHLLSKEARLRFNEVNIFTDISVVEQVNEYISQEQNALVSKFIHNRRFGYARSFMMHFFDNLEPSFLFISGDGNPKFSTQDVGQLYLIEAPLLGFGIILMFIEYPYTALFLLFWLVCAIVPAATARETPHALRILNSLPTWQIFIAFGIISIAQRVKKLKMYYFLLVVLYICSITYYIYNYHLHYPREFSNEWQYGYREALRFVSPIKDRYDNIFITDVIGRPYMYTLFYGVIDPHTYWQTKKSYFDASGFYHVDGFDKYLFVSTPPEKRPGEKSLVIGQPHWLSNESHALHTVTLLNGIPVLSIYEL